MAKRTKPQDDMEVQQIKDHLSRQDVTLKEILFILGGSAAMGVPGVRQDVKDLKVDVDKLKKSEAGRGQWIISLNTIPGAIMTMVMFIGGLLGIWRTVREITKEPPKEIRQQELPQQKQPQASASVHLPEFFPFLPSQELL
jgi:hypothetical protein